MNELYDELRSMKRKYLIATYLTVALIVAAVVAFKLVGAWGLALLAAAGISGVIAAKIGKKYNASYKKNVVSAVLQGCSYISDLRYAAEEGIAFETVADTGMMNMAATYDAGDLVHGVYKQVEFEQSDVHIQDSYSDGDGTMSYSSLFKGRIICLDGRDDLDGGVQIVAKKFRAEYTHGRKQTGTGNEEFDKTFKVYADRESDVKKLLDTNLMTSLMRLREKLNAPFMLMYTGGRLLVAVNNFSDAFEMNIQGKLDRESEKKRILDDMSVTTKVIDELAVYLDR